MKKILSLLVCALLTLNPLNALGMARMPQMRGTVTDDANVLGAQAAADVSAYAERLTEEAGIDFFVAVVHFLDGLDAQTYADELFARWNLDDSDVLLLTAAGEDSYAVSVGSQVQQELGKANVESLMFTASQFGAMVKGQQYDAAMAEYCTALNALVERQMGESIRMDGLFGQEAVSPVQQAQAYASHLWDDVMTAIDDSSQHYVFDHDREEREEDGLTAGGWILLIVLVFIMLRRNKAEKRYNRKRHPGCLGWFFGLFGINILIDIIRRRHGR